MAKKEEHGTWWSKTGYYEVGKINVPSHICLYQTLVVEILCQKNGKEIGPKTMFYVLLYRKRKMSCERSYVDRVTRSRSKTGHYGCHLKVLDPREMCTKQNNLHVSVFSLSEFDWIRKQVFPVSPFYCFISHAAVLVAYYCTPDRINTVLVSKHGIRSSRRWLIGCNIYLVSIFHRYL